MLNTLISKVELGAGSAILLADKIDNPLDGVTPNIDVFGVKFSGAIAVLLGGAWALALAFCVFFMIKNAAAWGAARQRGMSDDMEDGATGLKRSSIAFGVVAGIGVLVGAIIAIVGMF